MADKQLLTFGCRADSRLVITKSTTGTAEEATKACWRVEDLAGEVARDAFSDYCAQATRRSSRD